MPRPYKGRSGRIQARGAGGRFRQWTGEEFGIGVCPRCQHITMRPELPQTPFIDPRDFNARVCPECGWDSRKPNENPERPKIRAKHQGTLTVEYDEGNGYTLLFPDGSVQFATSKKSVEQLAKRWSKENIPDGYNAGMLEIDYR